MHSLRSIDDVVQAFRHAQLDGDAAAAARLFTEDAVLYPPVAPAVVRGRAAIAELLEGVHRRLRILDEDYTDLARGGSADVAYLHWRYRIRVQARGAAASQPVTVQGRILWVLRRADDEWRIAVDHASVDPAPPGSS